jgi:hypothetical protein
MTSEPATYPGYCFPAEIISHAVWLYHVFSLSLRDVELILAERGIAVTHESIRQWGLRFGADFARKLRRRRPKPGDTWHLDEVYLRINGVLHYLWRAVDQQEAVLALKEALAKAEETFPHADIPPDVLTVSLHQWRSEFFARSDADTYDARKKAFQRGSKEARNVRAITLLHDRAWLVSPE